MFSLNQHGTIAGMSELVGRDLELALLDTCLSEALSGAGRTTWISGEAGIGKTRLAEELSQRAERAGALVTWGRSWEGEGTPALWLWVQALRRLAAEPMLRTIVERARPELGALFGDSATAADPEQARFRLFDAVARLLREVSAVRPLVVVLDDLHAADSSSLSLLRFVARDLRGSHLLVLGTARDTDDEAVARVAREALHIPLGRLTRDDVARLIARTAPRFADEVETVFATSEGNPLFVEELLAARTKQLPMPPSIRAAIRAHLALVSADTRTALENASVFGREVPSSRVADIIAHAHGILVDGRDGNARFSHVLLRDELYAGMDTSRRVEQHRVAGAWFAREGAKLAAAHHVLLGAPKGDEVQLAVTAAIREAYARLAFEDAARLADRALAFVERDSVDECLMQMASGEAWILAGTPVTGRRSCLRAAEIAEALQRPDLVGRAALTYAAEHGLGRDEAIVGLLRRAIASLDPGDSALRAELLARLSLALIPHRPGERDETTQLRTDAIAMARRVGADSALFTALRCAVASGAENLTPIERLEINREALELAHRLGDTARMIPLVGWQIVARLDLGDAEGATESLTAAVRLIESFPQPHHRVRAPLLSAMFAALNGRFAESTGHARSAARIAEQSQHFEAMLLVAIHRSSFQYIRDDDEGFAEFEPLIDRMMGGTPGGAMFHAFNHAIAGRVDEARAALTTIRALPLDAIPYIAGLGWVCVWRTSPSTRNFSTT